ncbi:hypothetical protein AAH979_15650 [Plantactinospora sp. ZYX-F-223]|uniref:type II secretion system F family protein n=1 Tax=Plantactinospora sp. ZYX-F-223 TaxID=3144103 RepID=UPI0031FD070F
MTTWWLAAVCLAGAATLVGWPVSRARARRRAVIGGHHAVQGTARRPDPGGWSAEIGSAKSRVSWSTALDRLLAAVSPRRAVVVGVVLGGVGGTLAGGPVAGLAVAAYTGLAIRGLLRRRAGRSAERAQRRQLDALCGLAADLRAGLPPSTVMLAADGSDRLASLARAAVRLAEQTGAPLADLLERIEADARAMDRGLAAAEAQAAGARATAWLLAGLPAGGIALGYGIGVDPLEILLHTPIGAACAVGAIILQLTGLVWAGRLSGAGRADRLGSEADRADRVDEVGESAGGADRFDGGFGRADRSGGGFGGGDRSGGGFGGGDRCGGGFGGLAGGAGEVDGFAGRAGKAGRVASVATSGR